MKSVMRHQFSRVPTVKIQRSSFDRSHGRKTTFDAGLLIPCFVDEALPGDTFNLNMTAFARLATPIVPLMDNMMLSTFFFAVPMRLVWDNWEKFNGQQTDPGDSTDFLIPQMVSPTGGYLVESLSDYLGLPTEVEGFSHSSLWHRAYNLFITTGLEIRIYRILLSLIRMMARMTLLIMYFLDVVRGMIILLRVCRGHRKVILLICLLVQLLR